MLCTSGGMLTVGLSRLRGCGLRAMGGDSRQNSII